MGKFAQRWINALQYLFRNNQIPEIETNIIRANREHQIPVYSDVRDVDNPQDGTRIQLDGSVQEPAGVWWRHNDKWYSGDRTQTTINLESLGANSSQIYDIMEFPDDMEIDIWQAHIATAAGTEDVYIDIYNETDDQVIYEYSLADNGNMVTFGDPIDVVSVDNGDTVHIRSRNDTGSSVTFSAWLVWSFQSTLV